METTYTPENIKTNRARAVVTGVFFMWGLSYGLLEVLNKHFQEILAVSKAQSGLLQTAYFSAYFLAAFPAATFMRHAGYKNGLVLGLCLYALGAFLFIPASFYGEFWPFLLALFVLACGLACLETAANPLMVELGDAHHASKRLNLAQSFCGLGCFLGPLLGGVFLFHDAPAMTSSSFDAVRAIYAGLAVVVILIALYIKNTPSLSERQRFIENGHGENATPEQTSAFDPLSPGLSPASGREERSESLCDFHVNEAQGTRTLTDWTFIGGVAALFFYVAAQVGVGAFFINYVTEYGVKFGSKQGAFLLSLSLFIFMVGRFVSTWLMGYIAPARLLHYYSLASVLLCWVVVMGYSGVSIAALVGLFFFMSTMFPTIFSIAIAKLGRQTKRGSSLLMMGMIGGAIAPYAMGFIADRWETKLAYWAPLGCFVVISVYSQLLRRFRSDHQFNVSGS